MPARSGFAAWFAALVFLASSVLLLEYVLFVGNSSSEEASLKPTAGPAGLDATSGVGVDAAAVARGGGGGGGGGKGISTESKSLPGEPLGRRLAVVVPAHAGDLGKALASFERWPKACYPSTGRNVDLVLYYAGGEEDGVAAVLPTLEETGGRCFARTKLVLANLSPEDNVYPKGPSVQFYKMFLDEAVRRQFSEYDAFALLEWDVIVAHEKSFDKLYSVAFGSVEPYWVKGSTLEGVNFHETVVLPDSRHVLGHINGNAIYNNTDPAFVEFVNYTLARWEYTQSYDVALWATIADLPYSWPLWQRYSRKFIATDLIANVGFLDVDDLAIAKAVASEILFIHGSLSGGGGSMFSARSTTDLSPALSLVGDVERTEGCTAACVSDASRPFALGTSVVCDRSCAPGSSGAARFGGYNCGAGNAERFGALCRTCYEDVELAQAAEEALRATHGALRGGVEEGHAAEKEGLEHVIMCETLLPPPSPVCSAKCLRKADTICDQRCGSGSYGDYNCNWRGHGPECRFCFNDREVALVANEVADHRGGSVVMCHTYEPPTEEDDWQAPPVEDVVAPGVDAPVDGERPAYSDDDDERDEPLSPAMEPYVKDIKRGELCAFIVGLPAFLSEVRVVVRSVMHFMPGIRIAVSTHSNDFSVYNRTLGSLEGVRVSEALSPLSLSPLFADRHCGEGTRLILHMTTGEMLSRAFTSKDTHSLLGDLLVVYAEVGRVGETSRDRTLVTTSVLGFSSPSFSFGMDIMLPAEANQQLREVLLSDPKGNYGPRAPGVSDDRQVMRVLGGFKGAFIPEILAALMYARNPPGIWFVNPQQWVTHHMFEPASVWDIPLVKPRFGCGFDLSGSLKGFDVAAEMEVQLGHFASGGTCERGFIHIKTNALRPKANIEFGPPTKKSMPSLETFAVSVVLSVPGDVDPELLNLSLESLVEKFPDAAEVVVVFSHEPKRRKRLQQVMQAIDKKSLFQIKAIEAEGSAMGEWTGLHSDKHAFGDFIMHMEAGDVLMQDVTYDNIFHFGNPVLPFTRFVTEAEGNVADPVDKCTAESMTFAMGEPVVHDFALTRSLVYPRQAYVALRHFIKQEHGADIDTFARHGRTSCRQPDDQGSKGESHVLPLRRFDANLLGAFLWYRAHNFVHWRALHPLDVAADEWLSDVRKYDLFCGLGDMQLPQDANEAALFARAAGEVSSREMCKSLRGGVDDSTW